MPHADLHLHTNFSDGTLTPVELVREIALKGIEVISVSDHDIVDGLPAATREAKRHKIRVIPGVELSSAMEGKEVHVLGLFIDPEHRELSKRLSEFRGERLRRGKLMVERLKKLGLHIDYDELAASVVDGGSLGRPHIARKLMEAGYVTSIPDAFDRYLGMGRPGYVGKAVLSPAQAIDLVHTVGGLAFLAHPGALRRDDMVPKLFRAGLDGIEAYHSDHDAKTALHYRSMAERFGKLVSGGSDFHGENKGHAPLGSGGLMREDYERLLAAAGAET